MLIPLQPGIFIHVLLALVRHLCSFAAAEAHFQGPYLSICLSNGFLLLYTQLCCAWPGPLVLCGRVCIVTLLLHRFPHLKLYDDK